MTQGRIVMKPAHQEHLLAPFYTWCVEGTGVWQQGYHQIAAAARRRGAAVIIIILHPPASHHLNTKLNRT